MRGEKLLRERILELRERIQELQDQNRALSSNAIYLSEKVLQQRDQLRSLNRAVARRTAGVKKLRQSRDDARDAMHVLHVAILKYSDANPADALAAELKGAINATLGALLFDKRLSRELAQIREEART